MSITPSDSGATEHLETDTQFSDPDAAMAVVKNVKHQKKYDGPLVAAAIRCLKVNGHTNAAISLMAGRGDTWASVVICYYRAPGATPPPPKKATGADPPTPITDTATAIAAIDSIKSGAQGGKHIAPAIRLLLKEGWPIADINARAGKSASWASMTLRNAGNSDTSSATQEKPDGPAPITPVAANSDPELEAALAILDRVKEDDVCAIETIVNAIHSLRSRGWQHSVISSRAGQSSSWSSQLATPHPQGLNGHSPATPPPAPPARRAVKDPAAPAPPRPERKKVPVPAEEQPWNTDADLLRQSSQLQETTSLSAPDGVPVTERLATEILGEILGEQPSLDPSVADEFFRLVLARIGNETTCLKSLPANFFKSFKGKNVDDLIAIITALCCELKRWRKALAHVGKHTTMTDILRERFRDIIPPFQATVERLLANGFNPKLAMSAEARDALL